MQLTAIKIIPFDTGARYGKIRAYVEIEFDHAILVKGVKLMETGSGGLFVAYPSVRGASGAYADLIVPQSKEVAAEIRDQVVAAYRASLRADGEVE